MAQRPKIKVATWTEPHHAGGEAVRYHGYIECELRVGDLAGDLAERGFETIEHEPCPPGAFTFSAGIDVTRRGRTEACGAGKLSEHLPTDANYVNGWSAARLAKWEAITDRWHLNTMRAGCAHQTIVYETDQYGRTVPSLTLTEPCPETGYKYGHAWLVEILPSEVLAEIASFDFPVPEAAREASVAYERARVAARLEYLRGEIRAERISMGEIHELQGLADEIAPGDMELLEWAGVPEEEAHERDMASRRGVTS